MTNNLIEAIHRGDTSEMDRQLEGVGVDVNAMDTNGTTALMVASTKGLAKLVKRLLNLGANAKLVDNNGKTSLMAGAMCGDKEVVSALLEAGAGVTIRAQWRGFTALELAGESQQAKERFGGGGEITMRSRNSFGRLNRLCSLPGTCRRKWTQAPEWEGNSSARRAVKESYGASRLDP